MCWPKENGGMGFRDLAAFNQALLARQGWRILNFPASLASKVLKVRYFSHSSFLSCVVGRCPSLVWRSIFWGREILWKGVRWRVDNGNFIGIYEDQWIPRPSTFKTLSQRLLPDGTTVSFLLKDPGNWDVQKVQRYFLSEDAECILSIPLSSSPLDDDVLWHYDKLGVFSVKSAYKIALQSLYPATASSSNGPSFVWKALWSLDLPSKIKAFCWRACKQILPTRALIWKRNIMEHGFCLRCGIELEFVDHAL